MSLRKNLSEAIRDVKECHGLSYEEIIDIVGCSKTSLRYALNGGENVSIGLMENILNKLGYSVSISLELQVF